MAKKISKKVPKTPYVSWLSDGQRGPRVDAPQLPMTKRAVSAVPPPPAAANDKK